MLNEVLINIIRMLKIHSIIKSKRFSGILLDRIFSFVLRRFFKISFLNEIKCKIFKKVYFEKINEFWVLRIGFANYRKYIPFINVDPYFSNLINSFYAQMPFICSKLEYIPINASSCQMIQIKYLYRYFNKKKKFLKAIQNWYKLLIPGGTLRIEFKYKKDKDQLIELKKNLEQCNFYIENIDKSNIKINNKIIINSKKEVNIELNSIRVPKNKVEEITDILKFHKSLLREEKSIGLIGYKSKFIKDFLKGKNIYNGIIRTFSSIEQTHNISKNFFDLLIIQNYFEFCNYSQNHEIYNELRRITKKGKKILIILPNKKKFFNFNVRQLFEKGIFIKQLDQHNIAFDSIKLNQNLNLIQSIIINADNFPRKSLDKKILLLGNYSLRYTYLINARWDSQARSLKKLGYKIKIIDVKDNSFHYIKKYLDWFKPDIIWSGGKLVIEFFRQNSDYFRKSNIQIIYWLWDIRKAINYDFRNIIDFMFVTTKNDIEKYKKSYNIENVFWMPASITPEIIQGNQEIEKKYDIGFAGSLDYDFHKKRTQIINFLKTSFNIKIFQNIYNDLPEYYSQCKIIFGGSPDQKDQKLYMSNRIFVAMSCGLPFFTNYFKGLEKLFENEKHLVWYNNKRELLVLLEKYLSNKKLRHQIGKNAHSIIRKNHNYLIRIKNMLDIINGRTEKFYGFIEEK